MKNIASGYFILLLSVIVALLIQACMKQDYSTEPGYDRETVERGEQLVNEGKCNYCHTPSIQSEEGTIPDPDRLLSGHPSGSEIPEIPNVPVGSQQWLEFLSNLESTVWAGPWGISFAANLTPDDKTGIGTWSVENFINTMRTGKHAGIGRRILPPMPWDDYRELSDRDLLSIFAYLRTIEPVRNDVPDPIQLEGR